MLARTFSFSTHELQLDPTETYNSPSGQNDTGQVTHKMRPPVSPEERRRPENAL